MKKVFGALLLIFALNANALAGSSGDGWIGAGAAFGGFAILGFAFGGKPSEQDIEDCKRKASCYEAEGSYAFAYLMSTLSLTCLLIGIIANDTFAFAPENSNSIAEHLQIGVLPNKASYAGIKFNF